MTTNTKDASFKVAVKVMNKEKLSDSIN